MCLLDVQCEPLEILVAHHQHNNTTTQAAAMLTERHMEPHVEHCSHIEQCYTPDDA